MDNVIQLANLTTNPKRNNPNSSRLYDSGGLSPTLNTCGGGNHEPLIIEAGKMVYDDHSCTHQQDFVQHYNGISRTIPAGTHASTPHLLKTYIDMNTQDLKGKKFRIRKLTPRECFRLMGVDDADIDKIQASGISNSGQYKLAGNSIVVDVLFHLFRKMFIETGVDFKENKQLSLF